jgi:cbb3-type cytochrome oxidase maturation protein
VASDDLYAGGQVSVLFVLVPLALLLVAIFVGAYVWSSRTGQFDDLTTPAMRAVFDDDKVSDPLQPPEAR